MVIMFFLFFISMYMILVVSKYTDLNYIKGGAVKNLIDAIKETFISTPILLNNMIFGTKANLRFLQSEQQFNAVGVDRNPGWIPFAMADGYLQNPTLHNSFKDFRTQFLGQIQRR